MEYEYYWPIELCGFFILIVDQKKVSWNFTLERINHLKWIQDERNVSLFQEVTNYEDVKK